MVSKILAFVGTPGSGKSEAVAVVESKGFTRIRFGDATDEEIKNWLLPELYYSIDKDTWTKKMKNEAKKILEAV